MNISHKIRRNDYEGIGAIGQSAFQFLNPNNPPQLLYLYPIPNNISTFDNLVDFFHLSKYRAKTVLDDRRAYLCYIMTERRAESIIGVLFLDSSKEDSFTAQVVQEVENYAPIFASIINGSKIEG
jgi:hypothetical protein